MSRVGSCHAMLFVAGAMLPSCTPRDAAWPIDPRAGQDDQLALDCASGASFVDAPAEVIHHEGLVWLRGERGALASLDLQRATLAHHFTSEVVVDVLSTRGGVLWVLTYDPVPEDVRVWERTAVGWTPLVQMSAPAEPMLALGELDERPLLVSARALYLARDDGLARARSLARPLSRALGYSAIMTADEKLWVAVDRGELGGELLRVDPENGAVRRARLHDAAGNCGQGPACTRITSLLVDPEESDCVLASVGAPKGRMARICGALAPELLASPPERQLADQTMALAFVHPAGSPERERLRLAAHSLIGLAPLDNMAASSVDAGRRVRALAPSRGGYLAIAAGSLYRADASGVARVAVKSVDSRCGLDVTLADGAIVIESPKQADRTFLIATADSGARPTLPPPPCEGAQVYYAWGYSHEGELLDWGYAALFSCRAGEPVLLERGDPNRRVPIERRVWDELWRDLERARWRTWSSCTGGVRPEEPRERLVIARGDQTLRVDCPVSRHRPEHEAAVLRIRHLAGLFAED